MGATERVIHVIVSEFRQSAGEAFIVRLLFRMKAKVLEEERLPALQP